MFAASPDARAGLQIGTNSVPVPTQIQVEQDDRVATLSWNSFPQWGPDNPPGVYGYQIRWGLAGAAPDHTSYACSPVIQLQPLVNGQQYQATVYAIDAYGHLSAPAPAVTFTGSSARVDALRQQMNGFFDDFNLPAGPVDELKWNVATSRCNDPAKNGFFINDQFHAHSMLGDKYGDRGQLVSRPRAPFLIGGRTGTIVFDFDGAQRRDFWYLDIMPKYLDITGHISLETAPGYPGNMLRIRQTGNSVQAYWIDATGTSHLVGYTNDLMMYHVKLIHNVRRHWKVTVSQSLVQVFIDNKQVISAAVSIPWTVGFIHWNAFSYNTSKANEPQCLMHWDNFGFDAPSQAASASHGGDLPAVVTHNYRTVPSDGSEFSTLYNFVPYSTSIAVPDSVHHAAEAMLMFSMQMGAGATYLWNAADAVTVNGQTIPIPQPAAPPVDPNILVSGGQLYTMAIPVSPSLIKQGLNTVSFAMLRSGVLDVHLEVYFPKGDAPAYTQPSDVAALLSMPMISIPDMGTVGPAVAMGSLNGQPLYPYLQGTAAQSMQNVLPASGILTLVASANGDIALGSTGKPCGVSRVEFLVDQQVVTTVQTSADCPAMGGDYTFTLDTTRLSNGRHELFVRAFSPTGAPSIPDYISGEGTPGQYYPLVINVTN